MLWSYLNKQIFCGSAEADNICFLMALKHNSVFDSYTFSLESLSHFVMTPSLVASQRLVDPRCLFHTIFHFNQIIGDPLRFWNVSIAAYPQTKKLFFISFDLEMQIKVYSSFFDWWVHFCLKIQQECTLKKFQRKSSLNVLQNGKPDGRLWKIWSLSERLG